VEIGAEAAQFPEKEYINGIAVAVCLPGRLVIGAWVLLRAEISFSTCRPCFILLMCSFNYILPAYLIFYMNYQQGEAALFPLLHMMKINYCFKKEISLIICIIDYYLSEVNITCDQRVFNDL
jgi:hypothetical protein